MINIISIIYWGGFLKKSNILKMGIMGTLILIVLAGVGIL
jgi:hypothetical protein